MSSLPFLTTHQILKGYYPPEEFHLFTVYGPLGYGKSAFSFKVMVEVLTLAYKISVEEAWEMVKQFIIFHPEHFFQKLEEIKQLKYPRIPGLVWDDAGLWLYALDWNDPFIEAVGKYLNVARTHLASLICSTPLPTWIFKKLRGFPQAINLKIMKVTGNPHGNDRFKRRAVAYQQWQHPDMKRTGVRKIYEEDFSCKMADQFYKWYKPLRDAYEDLAFAKMQEEWAKIRKKSDAFTVEQYPQLQIPKLAPRQI